MVDLFISYKREDEARAKQLAERLKRDRGWRYWWDANIISGEVFNLTIEEELTRADLVLVLWSELSKNSDFVIAEATLGDELGKLVPIRIDEVRPPVPFNAKHTFDLSNWNGSPSDSAYSKLLDDLDRRVQALGHYTGASPEESQQPPTPTLAPSPRHRRAGKWLAVGAAVVLAATSLWHLWPGDQETPTLLAPPDDALFSHVPRTLQFRWEPVPHATAYYVEIQAQDPPSGTWFDYPGQSIIPIQGTSLDFEFIGSQPGRWRVGTLARDGARGPPSPWRHFIFNDATPDLSTVKDVPVVPYDPTFLGQGHVISIPAPTGRALSAAFAQGEPVDYLHYSLRINQQRSMAMVAAINMDRAKQLSVRRRPSDFLVDPRLPRAIQRDDYLYRHNDWDRGHLVARTFVTWDDAAVVDPTRYQKAVSFYSATAPQHGHFNRTTWLGIERYFQERFVPTAERIVVFVGPVFHQDDPTYRRTRIPRGFWMVGVAVDPQAPGLLLAEGFLADQLVLSQAGTPVLGDDGEPTPAPSVRDVDSLRASLASISEQTDLDFGYLLQYDSWNGDR